MIHDLIVTERLTLCPLRADDAAQMVSVLASESLYEFTGGEPPSLAELEDRYRRQLAGPEESKESWLNWIIRTNEDGRAVGFVQATVTGLKAELAWLVGVEHQGAGLAAESAGAAKAWLAGNGIGRIGAYIHTEHTTSQAVATRIGLAPTGAFDDDGEELWAAAPTPAWDN